MSCWTWAELDLRVQHTFREKGKMIGQKAIESALRSRLAEEGSYMEPASQRYGH